MKASDVLLDGIVDTEVFESSHIKKSLLYYLRYWKLFLISFVVVFSLVFAYIYFAIPLFQVNSVIMLKDESKGSVFLENPVLSELSDFKSYQITDNEIDVLQSSDLMRQAIKDLNFNYLAYHKNFLGKLNTVSNSELPFIIEVINIDEEYLLDKEFEVLGIENNYIIYSNGDAVNEIKFEETFQNEFAILKIHRNKEVKEFDNYPLIVNLFNNAQLASMMSGSLKVEPKDKNSSILYVSLKTEFPDMGVQVVNELVNTYNENAVAEKKEVALNSLEFLDTQLAMLSAELSGMQSNIETFKYNKDVVDVENDSKFYQQNAFDNSKQISINRSQLEILGNLKSEVLSGTEQSITLGPLSNDDPALLLMIQDFNNEVDKLDRLKGAILPENPVYVNTTERISSFRNKIVAHLDDRIDALEISTRNLEKASATYNSKYHSGPMIQRQYEALTRDLDFKKAHYINLIEKREETSLYLASVSSTHSKTIEKAYFSPVPVSPNKPILGLIGLFIAFAAPFSYLFVKRTFQGKLEDRSQIVVPSSSSVLGELSQIDKKPNGPIIDQNSKTPIAEQLRYVRTSYCLNDFGKESQVTLVTSTVSGEGKTFFALNFAKSMSLIGKKTAVLFYDLRKPLEYAHLFDKGAIGISEFINNKNISFKQFLEGGLEYQGVTLFHTGKLPHNPAEILLSPRNQELINEMRKHFEFIVLDSAPVGQVSDSFSLIPLVDATIYMMRYNWTTKHDIEFFHQLKAEAKINNPMLVLNGSRAGQGYSYGNYQYN